MISTLLFDLGGTLHSVRRTDASCLRFAGHLIDRLSQYGVDLDTTPAALAEIIRKNGEEYKRRGERDLTELSQGEIWNDYYLKEFRIGRDRLDPIAEELSFLYDYERVINMRKPRLRETVLELHGMGIRMGVVSNIISTSLVPHMLNEYGISEYMECVVLSSSAGIRKPDPRIFFMALDRMGVGAAETGYVGDTLSRDVLGARNAGLGLAVRISNPSAAHRDAALLGPDAPREDYLIEELYELPDIVRRVNGAL